MVCFLATYTRKTLDFCWSGTRFYDANQHTSSQHIDETDSAGIIFLASLCVGHTLYGDGALAIEADTQSSSVQCNSTDVADDVL